MLIYNELKNKSREFLTATGLKLDEFEKLLPAFQTAYEQKYPPHLTQAGKTRQRQIGGGATGALPKSDDKLFFILVYQKTTPLQTMHGLQFGLSQPPSQRLDSSAPASLATGLAHPRGGPRARRASCGDQ